MTSLIGQLCGRTKLQTCLHAGDATNSPLPPPPLALLLRALHDVCTTPSHPVSDRSLHRKRTIKTHYEMLIRRRRLEFRRQEIDVCEESEIGLNEDVMTVTVTWLSSSEARNSKPRSRLPTRSGQWDCVASVFVINVNGCARFIPGMLVSRHCLRLETSIWGLWSRSQSRTNFLRLVIYDLVSRGLPRPSAIRYKFKSILAFDHRYITRYVTSYLSTPSGLPDCVWLCYYIYTYIHTYIHTHTHIYIYIYIYIDIISIAIHSVNLT